MVLNEPDFLTAINDLIIEVTGIEQERLFRGNQSREVLPSDDNFILYTPLYRNRRGTNINSYSANDETGDYSDKVLVTSDVQIDCYGDKAEQYAQAVEGFCKSVLCNSWLKSGGYGISVLYTNNPADFTRIDDTAQYVKRWIITITVCFTYELTNEVPWFDDVEFNIKNVDVYFKP